MADNTVLNPGVSGDTVRTIDRSLDSPAISAKTQVVQLDVGGQSAEALVTDLNPMAVFDQNIDSAKTSDTPIFTAVAGDPAGDFAGVNLLEQWSDPGSGIGSNVNILNQPRQDSTGSLILSDAPAPIQLRGAVGSTIVIDTQGYQTINITTATMGANLTCSEDGVVYSNMLVTNKIIYAIATSTLGVGASYSGPILGRYVKFTVTTAGTAVVNLRNSVFSNYLSYQYGNIVQIGTTNVVTGGVNGTLAVGGNIADGTAPTINPVLVGGWERTGNTTRRMLVDAVGGVVLGSSTQNNGQSFAPYTVFTNTVASSNTLVIKAGAGRLTHLSVSASSAVACYLHICNSTTVTTGTTASTLCYALPAVAGTCLVPQMPDGGMYFGTGISCYLSGGVTSTDNTAIGSAPSVVVNATYI